MVARPKGWESGSDAAYLTHELGVDIVAPVVVLQCFESTRVSRSRIIDQDVKAIYARYPDPAFIASSVNRASCLSLSKALALELGREQILVNSVNIGIVDTPQWDAIHQRRSPGETRESFLNNLASREIPLQRVGSVEEVSGLVAFLVSARATYITGASIDVSGGMGQYL